MIPLPPPPQHHQQQQQQQQQQQTTMVPRLFRSCNFEWNQQRKLPEKFDWRRKGIVTSVKNQATCGSCYAFASISTVESLILRKQQKQRQRYRRSSRHYEYSSFNDDDDDQIWMNKVKPHHHHGHGGDINLSEQHVVNCVGKCHGSSVIKLFNFLRNEGITYEHLEPYNNKPSKCHNNYPVRFRIKDFCFNYQRVHSNEEIMAAIIRYGPIFGAAAFDKRFQFLRGVYHGSCRQSRKHLHHSIVIVGWTRKNWIIKNSWNKDWGIDGYLYLPKNKPNNCGIGWIVAAPIGLVVEREFI
nr:cathepsin K-like [Dermatophagoides farinae]